MAEEEVSLLGDYNVSGIKEVEVKEKHSAEEQHFIVIHVGEGSGFSPIVESVGTNKLKKATRAYSDPYVKISIDDKPEMTLKTPVIFDCRNDNPQWQQFQRIYLNPNRLPQIIKVSAFDKSDEPQISDAQYGYFELDCEKEKIFDRKGKIWRRIIELGSDNCKFLCEICYDCCSGNTLKRNMEERAFSKEDNLSSDTKEWIGKNTQLFLQICHDNVQAMELTTDMFANIAYPPMKYKIDCQFKAFANGYSLHENCKNGIYYDEELDVLYVLENNSDYNMNLGGLNITAEVHLLWRYVFMKSEIFTITGQDTEFNIYKSYIFQPTAEKLPFTFLAITIQIGLTVAVCTDIIRSIPDIESVFGVGAGRTMKLLSAGIFILLSIATNRTTQLHYAFYQRIGLMFSIPWYLLCCDFLSNIVIPIIITLFSYLFLIESETYTDLVLNAFALQFVSEIDDMVNTFDSDEDDVLQADLREFYNTNCAVPRMITYTWREFLGILWSPFALFISIWNGLKSSRSVFISKRHKFILHLKQS